MKYTDEQRVQKIYEYSIKLLDYIDKNHITKEDLISEETLQWLVTTPLYNIGEHAYSLSNEYKECHEETNWTMIAGLRHRLVHDYDGINWSIIVYVCFSCVYSINLYLAALPLEINCNFLSAVSLFNSLYA